MQWDDAKSRTTIKENFWDSSAQEISERTQAVWNYGQEAWCNLEGQYTSIVADFSHLKGRDYEMQICSLGVMGVEYIRDAPIPSAEVEYKDQMVQLSVENIRPNQQIGNELSIKLR